jgi:L-alanine-DL-glutamate epimerase-like enolase superfamily enzyme
MPNNVWFEMTQPQGITDQPWFKDRIRIDSSGYVPAPVKPGLGYELDRDAMEKMMVRVER